MDPTNASTPFLHLGLTACLEQMNDLICTDWPQKQEREEGEEVWMVLKQSEVWNNKNALKLDSQIIAIPIITGKSNGYDSMQCDIGVS